MSSTLAFSIIEIIFGIASICIEIVIMMLLPAHSSLIFKTDFMGHGLWAGLFYITAGSLGAAATRNKHPHSLLVATVVLGTFAIIASIATSLISGVLAALEIHSYSNDGYDFDFPIVSYETVGLELMLTLINILSFINSVVLTIVASVGLCRIRRQSTYIYGENDDQLLVANTQT